MSAALPLLLVSALLAQVPRENRFLQVKSASYDAEHGRFVAEGNVAGLPAGAILAASVGLPDVPPLWTRGTPEGGTFRLEIATDGREVLPGRYEVRVQVRPEDQDPTAPPLPKGLGVVGLDTMVGSADAAKQARSRLVKEDLAALEELRRLLATAGEASRAARQAQSLGPLKAKAFPEGVVWKRFAELRDAQGARDLKLFLHPAPAEQQSMAAVFGTWEKWFLSMWEETAAQVRVELPEEIGQLGAGGMFDRALVEDELRDVALAAYKSLGARSVEWKSGLPGPKDR